MAAILETLAKTHAARVFANTPDISEWDSVEERLIAWLIRLPKDAAESARDRIYRLATPSCSLGCSERTTRCC